MDNNIDVNITDLYFTLLDKKQLPDTSQYNEKMEELRGYIKDKSVSNVNCFDEIVIDLVEAERVNCFKAGFKAAFSLMKDINKQLGD